jgi:hypothetical protein
MTQHTSRLCKGYLSKKESDEVLHQMTWPPQSPDLAQLKWFVMSWKIRQQLLSVCGNSFKTAEKALKVKLVERMSRVGKAVIKAKG